MSCQSPHDYPRWPEELQRAPLPTLSPSRHLLDGLIWLGAILIFGLLLAFTFNLLQLEVLHSPQLHVVLPGGQSFRPLQVFGTLV